MFALFHFNRCGRSLLMTMLALSLLASCGGVDSGGTGAAVAVGPIKGFGSIIVNSVRFDDRAATILDDEGATRTRDQLKLGVMTEVDASGLAGSAGNVRATASLIRVSSDIIGPVGTINQGTSSFTVLGQTVLVTAATVFDARLSGGLSGLQSGMVVEVYGRYDQAKNRYAATRIEPKADAEFYKLRGAISAVDLQAKTLVIGGQTINYSQLPPVQALNAGVGNLVRAKLRPTTDAGVWMAIALPSGVTQLPDRDNAQIEGRISAWVSSRQFSVDGIPVDASNATFPEGEAAVVLSARVEVEGASRGGVLLARVVHVEGDEAASNSSFELHGAIDTLDGAAKTFSLRGVTVDYSGPVDYQAGTASDLAVGRSVNVQGTLSSDGSRIVAQRIIFDGT